MRTTHCSLRRGTVRGFGEIIDIDFIDGQGEVRTLLLSLPPQQAPVWRMELQALLERARLPGLEGIGPSHWMWALACADATMRGGCGAVPRSDFRSLLNRANISLGDNDQQEATRLATEEESPQWMSPGTTYYLLLTTYYVLRTTYNLLLTTYYLLLTTNY